MKQKKYRYLYLVQYDDGLFKVGMTKTLKRRLHQLKYEHNGGNVNLITFKKLPYQCTRCAENAIVWGCEFFSDKFIEHVNCFLENVEKKLAGKKCSFMWSNENKKKVNNKCNMCGAFKGVIPVICSINYLDNYITE